MSDGGDEAALLNRKTGALAAGVIYHDSFDDLTPGLSTDKRAFQRHIGVAWANGFAKPGSTKASTNRITADSSSSIRGSRLSRWMKEAGKRPFVLAAILKRKARL